MSLRAFPVRYRILSVLFVLSFINYLLRNNLSVALPSIRQEFGFSSAELGWILGSFNFAYALFQIPGGIFGEVYGPRRALTIIAVSWGVLTFLTGFAPALMAASATGVIVALIVVRFMLGVTNAPMYPVSAGTFASSARISSRMSRRITPSMSPPSDAVCAVTTRLASARE